MKQPISSIVGGQRRELLSMSWAEYLDFPALNGSVIVKGRKSLLHLKHQWDHGSKDTDYYQFGRLMHCLLFEPNEVENRFRPWAGVRIGANYALFCATAFAAGAEVVREDGAYSLNTALDAAPAFLRNDRVQALIRAGQAEQPLLAPECGVQCKGRIDWISTSEHVLTDLKTSAEIEGRLFGKAFFRYGYDIKLGLYKRWLDAVTGERWPVEVIVLESKAPYDVAVVPIPDAVLDAGVEKALRIIQDVRQAIETDEWPGVARGEMYPLDVPFYEMEEETEVFEG